MPLHCTLPEDLLADGLASMALHLEIALADSPARIEIDARALEHVDSAGMQLLYAFACEARTRGKTLDWHGVRPSVAEAARLLGMGDMLALDDQ